jgi:hypothetical protein
MERPMSIVLTDETTPVIDNDPHHWAAPEETVVAETSAAPEPRNQPPVTSSQQRNADARSPLADHPMRLPSFDEVCPHVRDHIIPMNGGHFNVDHYLRVLRAKVETDESIAMALTAFGQQKTTTRPHRPTPWRYTHHVGGAP